ncbi:MAG: hypothetical protein CMP84_06115, partial [Gammaproteobacteria bacterium]|nr:hypothetical protein [Gammaproteobacteria bacterium]
SEGIFIFSDLGIWFFALLSFDLFVEGFVFEWSRWNGRIKNIWFFVLWWGVLFVWHLKGSISPYQRVRIDYSANRHIQKHRTKVKITKLDQ